MTVEPAYGTSTMSYGAKPSKVVQLKTNEFPQHEAEEPKIGIDDNEDLEDFFNSL